ncbi:sulfate ABC transporter permease [Vibrio viridaestus]|uniref:Sulfate ABC transporter permease n=1 Tax=Vibrio viridaestus TaxID=2487322 RepID=A0A3N9TF79_9VIBR|nr:sulfate ABC transporter permease [Vibrio viridaestus]RQW62700.1 sulfate ABC transporter permease [Vibrio viridaestus]
MKYLYILLTLMFAIPGYSQINLTDDVRLSGFGTFSLAISDSDVPMYAYRNIDDHLCYDCDSTFGVQLDWLISDSLRSSVQVVKRPQDSFSDPELEWGYLAYNWDNSTLKVGRLRLPTFIMSEYYYVSAAYPWSRTPADVYDNILGITHYDGMTYEWSHLLDNGAQIRLAPYISKNLSSKYNWYDNYYTLDTTPTRGATLEYSKDDSLWRMSYLHTNATQYKGSYKVAHFSLDVLSAGFNIEDDNFTYIGEGMLEQNLFANWYLGAAYQYDNIQPYVQYGQRRRLFENETITTGVKVNLATNLFVNLEYTHATSSHTPVSGHFNTIQYPHIDTIANLYTVSLSFLF